MALKTVYHRQIPVLAPSISLHLYLYINYTLVSKMQRLMTYDILDNMLSLSIKVCCTSLSCFDYADLPSLFCLLSHQSCLNDMLALFLDEYVLLTLFLINKSQ